MAKSLRGVIEVLKSMEDQPFFDVQEALYGNASKELRGGDWTGINFGVHDVSGYDFSGCQFDGNTDLSGLENIQSANFSGSLYYQQDGCPKLPEGVTAESLGIECWS